MSRGRRIRLRGQNAPARAWNARRPRAGDPRDVFGDDVLDPAAITDELLRLETVWVRHEIDELLDGLGVAVGWVDETTTAVRRFWRPRIGDDGGETS